MTSATVRCPAEKPTGNVRSLPVDASILRRSLRHALDNESPDRRDRDHHHVLLVEAVGILREELLQARASLPPVEVGATPSTADDALIEVAVAEGTLVLLGAVEAAERQLAVLERARGAG